MQKYVCQKIVNSMLVINSTFYSSEMFPGWKKKKKRLLSVGPSQCNGGLYVPKQTVLSCEWERLAWVQGWPGYGRVVQWTHFLDKNQEACCRETSLEKSGLKSYGTTSPSRSESLRIISQIPIDRMVRTQTLLCFFHVDELLAICLWNVFIVQSKAGTLCWNALQRGCYGHCSRVIFNTWT